MAGRVSCILHPPGSRFVATRPHFMELCEQRHSSAMLLSVFEFWTNVRIAQLDVGPEAIDLDRLWIYRSYPELIEDLCGAFGHKAVAAGVEHLVELELLERRNNPQYRWDRKYQYRLRLDLINAFLESSIESPKDPHPALGKDAETRGAAEESTIDPAPGRDASFPRERSTLPQGRSNTEEPSDRTASEDAHTNAHTRGTRGGIA